jgi:hypothetical protein
VRILRGPFRGARVVLSPRNSLRQIFGLYEHELNAWISAALPRVDKVLDVGANEGYFSFGCAAAFNRMNKHAVIHAFEPDQGVLEQFQQSLNGNSSIRLHRRFVGNKSSETSITLNHFAQTCDPHKTLIKIDVEGMELDVIEGASLWLNSSNLFLIEVHWNESFLTSLQNTFNQRGLILHQINQRPLPIIGRENRAVDCWWLVSAL